MMAPGLNRETVRTLIKQGSAVLIMANEHQKLVLVVDDEEMNLIVLSKILQRAGYEVATATNGQEAIDRSRRTPQPKIILMDLMMPLMSGWDATQEIKKDQSLAKIPVVAVTALSNEREATLAFGFDGFCPKPIDFNELIKMIEGFIGQDAA